LIRKRKIILGNYFFVAPCSVPNLCIWVTVSSIYRTLKTALFLRHGVQLTSKVNFLPCYEYLTLLAPVLVVTIRSRVVPVVNPSRHNEIPSVRRQFSLRCLTVMSSGLAYGERIHTLSDMRINSANLIFTQTLWLFLPRHS